MHKSEMKLILTGEPLSTQSIYKYACKGSFSSLYMTAKGKALKEDYQWQAKSQYKKKLLTTPLYLDITVYHGTHRVCDWDNFHKLSMDALTDIVWEDDSQITDAFVHKRYDKENPRIEILIHEQV